MKTKILNKGSESAACMRTYTTVDQLALMSGFMSEVEHLALHTLQEQLEWGEISIDRDQPEVIIGLRLGEILTANGIISSAVRDSALKNIRRVNGGGRLGDELLAMNCVSEMEIAFWLKLQSRLIAAARKVLAVRVY